MKIRNSSRARAAESLTGLMMLAAFAATFFAVFVSSRAAYTSVTEKSAEAEQARLALAYVLTALRDNDRVGAINVRELPNSEENALVIYTAEKTAAKWFYHANGSLMVFETTVGDLAFTPQMGRKIASLRNFSVTFDESRKLVTCAASYNYNGAAREEVLSFTPRTTVN